MANTTKGLKQFVQAAINDGHTDSKAGVNWLKRHHGISMRLQVFGRIRKQLELDKNKSEPGGTVRTMPLRTEDNPAGRPTPVAASTLDEQPHSVKERLATELAGLVRDYSYVTVQEMLRIVLAVNAGSK